MWDCPREIPVVQQLFLAIADMSEITVQLDLQRQRQLHIFKDHYAKILTAVTDPKIFGAELFSKGLISFLEFKNARSNSSFVSSMCDLLDYVYSALSMGNVSFHSFVDVLENLEPQTACIAKTIKEYLGKET